MQIIFDEKQQIFHLYNEKISYVIQVEKQRYLKHCYYGKRLKKWRGGIQSFYYDRGFCANPVVEDRTFSLDTQQREFPESGQGDFRSPAYELMDAQGDRNARFFYQGFQILKGKTAPEGLENVAGGDTVKVTYTGEISEVDPFNGTVISVEKQ
jgi:alpha-galactosidase